jgi:protein phosphatase
VEEDLFTAEAAPGSRLLLCTDGLHGMLEEEEIILILSEEADTEAAAERLVGEAKKGGGRDNITVILIDVLDTENS